MVIANKRSRFCFYFRSADNYTIIIISRIKEDKRNNNNSDSIIGIDLLAIDGLLLDS